MQTIRKQIFQKLLRVETCTHLSQNKQNELLEVLWEFEDLFDGTLGDWNTEPVSFELKRGAKPYHSRAFPIPKVHRTCGIRGT
jgi:hypothetical protein